VLDFTFAFVAHNRLSVSLINDFVHEQCYSVAMLGDTNETRSCVPCRICTVLILRCEQRTLNPCCCCCCRCCSYRLYPSEWVSHYTPSHNGFMHRTDRQTHLGDKTTPLSLCRIFVPESFPPWHT